MPRTLHQVTNSVPRQLFILLVALALLTGLRVGYTAVLRPHAQVHSLTQKSLQEFKLGNRVGAAENLKAAHLIMLTKPTQFSMLEKQRVLSLMSSIQIDTTNTKGIIGRYIIDYHQVLNSLDPLRQSVQVDTPQLPLELKVTHSQLQSAWRAIPQTRLVKANVRQFGADFRKGMLSPVDHLLAEKYALPDMEAFTWLNTEAIFRPPTEARFRLIEPTTLGVDSIFQSREKGHLRNLPVPKNAKLVDSWLAAPKEKRVFVVGARSDTEYVDILRNRFASQDLIFFFYQDCSPLCQESTVGAFFATSGMVISIDSPDSHKSHFIPVENALVEEKLHIGRRVILIDTDQAKRILMSGTGSGVATLLACSVLLAWDEPLCS